MEVGGMDLNLCYEYPGFDQLPADEQFQRLKRDLRNRSIYQQETNKRLDKSEAELTAQRKKFHQAVKALRKDVKALEVRFKELEDVARGWDK